MPSVYTYNDFFKLLKCTVAKPPICCSCFCNEQLNKNVKCGKEYLTLNVSNIVLVIFKTFITICWDFFFFKSHIKSQSQYLEKKIAIRLFSQIVQPYWRHDQILKGISNSRCTHTTAKDDRVCQGEREQP